jgi:hypothetical protein
MSPRERSSPSVFLTVVPDDVLVFHFINQILPTPPIATTTTSSCLLRSPPLHETPASNVIQSHYAHGDGPFLLPSPPPPSPFPAYFWACLHRRMFEPRIMIAHIVVCVTHLRTLSGCTAPLFRCPSLNALATTTCEPQHQPTTVCSSHHIQPCVCL